MLLFSSFFEITEKTITVTISATRKIIHAVQVHTAPVRSVSLTTVWKTRRNIIANTLSPDPCSQNLKSEYI
jgi:hypothetical protein